MFLFKFETSLADRVGGETAAGVVVEPLNACLINAGVVFGAADGAIFGAADAVLATAGAI